MLHIGRFVPWVLVVAFLACEPKEEEKSFIIEPDGCQLTANARIGAKAADWLGCRVRYDSTFKLITLQLIAPDTSGSFAKPGRGWLVINLNSGSAQHTKLPLRPGPELLPSDLGVQEATLAYVDEQGRLHGGSGSLTIGTNVISPAHHRFTLDSSLDGITLAAATPGPMSGSVQVRASGNPGGGSGTGGSGCADNGESCEQDGTVAQFKAMCESSQRACYCAAAYTYDCFLRKGCYQEAGASTSVTRAQLEEGKNTSNQQACGLNGCCF